MWIDPGTRVSFGAVSDGGGRRSVNEDAVLAEPPIFCVADGMGGHTHGAMAARTILDCFAELPRFPSQEITSGQVQAAIGRAQERIRMNLELAAPQRDEEMTAGSTVAGVVLTSSSGRPCWLAFNVGDSRIYRYADDRLAQVSVDHSLVQELVDAGRLSPEQALTHPDRHIITRAVGSASVAVADFWMLSAAPTDRILLCSDGLTGELADSELREELASPDDAETVAARLVARAISTPARDNVSAVVIDLSPAERPVQRPRTPVWAYDPEDTVPRSAQDDTQPTARS